MFSFFASYKYSPLKPATGPDGEFRLLTILPGPEGGNIRCTLEHVSLTSPPRYEALSYTWGDPKGYLCEVPAKGNPKRHYTIRIDGHHARVTYNLHSAIQELRHRISPRVVWVDAIYIDQKNNAERSEQVQLMAKIYSQASRVLVWLGEDDRYVDMAFDTIEQFCWVVKVRVWQYCSEKLFRPLSEITEHTVASLIKFENGRYSEVLDSPLLVIGILLIFWEPCQPFLLTFQRPKIQHEWQLRNLEKIRCQHIYCPASRSSLNILAGTKGTRLSSRFL